MKKFSVILSALAMTASAQAANSLEYDFRGDWQSLDYNDAAITTAPTTVADSTRFYLKVGRLQYKGSINDRYSYVGRLAFNKPAVDSATSNSKRDSLNSSVELAYITDKMSDMFSLSLGKFNTEIGGFEGATSGADLYMVSPYYQHSAVKTLTGANLGINESGAKNILYMTGVKGTLTFDQTQNVHFLATNNAVSDPTDASGNFNQNRGLMGIIWKGSFMEKTFQSILSYHEVSPQSSTANPDNKHSFLSAGIKYDSSWVGSLEYNTTSYKDGATGKSDSVYAAILKLGYKMDQWTPRLEFFTSEEKIEIASTATNKFTGVGAVLEYKPTAENFRYHIAYNNVTTKPATGDDQTRTEIVVGARLLGDMLK